MKSSQMLGPFPSSSQAPSVWKAELPTPQEKPVGGDPKLGP